MSNLKTFREVYERKLIAAIKRNPDRYHYSIDRAPTVARNMTTALLEGTGCKDSAAVKATCRELGIPYTYKGISAFLREDAA